MACRLSWQLLWTGWPARRRGHDRLDAIESLVRSALSPPHPDVRAAGMFAAEKK